MEEGFLTVRGHVFIRKRMAQCNYAGALGGSHLRDTWPSCNISEVVPRSHARLVSGEGISIKSVLNVCLCVFCRQGLREDILTVSIECI